MVCLLLMMKVNHMWVMMVVVVVMGRLANVLMFNMLT
jgi:hypothetical protein